MPDFLSTIKTELKKNKYKANTVLGFQVPKRDGSQRKLGILTVKDRVVQSAVKLLLDPIFEADFENSSFGFRCHRSTKLASLEVYKWLEAGNNHVFKGDIDNCFDSIPHEKLMECLKARIKDRHILDIVDSWLKAGVMHPISGNYPEKGILQGGIISPLLVNVYLDQFDNQWTEIGLKNLDNSAKGHLVRYADDFVILSKIVIKFEDVQGILNGLDLKLNRKKTWITTANKGFDFLGFYFVETFPEEKYKGNIHLYPANGSVQRLIESIGEITKVKEDENPPPDIVIQNVNKIVDSWLNYYHHTDYLAGIKMIQECCSIRIQEYIIDFRQNMKYQMENSFNNYLYNKTSAESGRECEKDL